MRFGYILDLVEAPPTNDKDEAPDYENESLAGAENLS